MRQWGWARLIKATRAGGAGGEHGVIQRGFTDGVLAVQIQTVPLFAHDASGAGHLVDVRWYQWPQRSRGGSG